MLKVSASEEATYLSLHLVNVNWLLVSFRVGDKAEDVRIAESKLHCQISLSARVYRVQGSRKVGMLYGYLLSTALLL